MMIAELMIQVFGVDKLAAAIAKFLPLPELNFFRQLSKATRNGFEDVFRNRIHKESFLPVGFGLRQEIDTYCFIVTPSAVCPKIND